MGANSVGKLTAQMIVESEQAESSLKKISALAKLAKTDLGSIGGLFLANGDFKKFGDGIDESTGKVRKHTEAIGEGEKALRGFYREQRLQDRTMRESKDALLGLTFGIMAVTSGMGEGSAKARQFQTSLIGGIAAMQAGEFAAFGLGTAGRNLGGTMGNLAGKLSQNAGLIGTIIGLGTGLYLFFSKANENAKKASEEGLKEFDERLKSIVQNKGALGLESELTKVNNAIARLTSERDALLSKGIATVDEYGVSHYSPKPSDRQQVDALNNQINLLGEYKDKNRLALESEDKRVQALQLINSKIGEQKDELGIIQQKQKELKDLEESRAKSTSFSDISAYTIKMAEKQKEIDALTETPEKRAERLKKLEEDRLKRQEEMNKSLVPWNDAIKEQAAFEKSAYESGGQTLDEYLEQLRALQVRSGIGEEYNALQIEINRVEKEHSDKIRQSAEEEKHALDDKTERIQLQYQLNKIGYEKAIEELEILRDATTDATQRLKIEQKIVDIKNDQIQKMSEQLDQAGRIGDLMQRALSKSGDDFISKLNQALQIAIQIARVMNKKDFGGPLDFLEIIGNGLGILALNTGSGSSSVPSSVGQNPQMALSMSSSGNIMANGLPYNPIRTSFPVGIPKGYLEQSMSSSSSTSGMLQEMRAMRMEISDLKNNPPVIIVKNPISLGKGLEIEYQKLNEFNKNKYE